MDHLKLAMNVHHVIGEGGFEHYCAGYGVSAWQNELHHLTKCPSCQREYSTDSGYSVYVLCEECGKQDDWRKSMFKMWS